MAFSNNSICYEAVQRTFRNSVVHFVRDHLRSAFPSNHSEKLRRPFQKEWEDLQRAALNSRLSGGTATTVKDEYDLLSVGHFYSIFDAYFSEIFGCSLCNEIRLPKPNRPKLLGALKSIKDFRDPLSHPVEEEVSYEEAVTVLANVRQVLLALGLAEQGRTVANHLRALDVDVSTPTDRPICVLPTQDSIYLDFVGRATVLDNLASLFNEAFSKRCLIAGDGGKGKSAVAYRYAQTFAAKDPRFKMIVWISAKKKRFEAGHAVPIEQPDFFDSESAINALLSQYGPVEENLSFSERKKLLLECLNDFPTFIVADDIDSVLDDADVVSLFTFEIPNTASRVLLTSRRDIPGIKSLTVSGFALAEAEIYIQSRIQQYELDASLYPPNLIKEIRETCDGSPLYIDDLIRLTKVVAPRKALSMWKERRGDEARKYALERELEQLSQYARSVLISAVVADHPASFTEIQSVLSFSEDRLTSAMTELQTLFLLPQPSLVEGEQRYHLNTNTKRLILSVEGNTDLFKRTEKKSRALAGTLPSVGRDIVGQLIRQAILLSNSGRLEDGEALLLKSIEHYPNAADLYGFLGYLYKSSDRVTDARHNFQEAAKHRSKNEETYTHWIKMELAEKEFTSAVRAANLGLALIPQAYKLVQLKADAKYQVANDFVSRLQTEKAERLWREIIEDIETALKPKSASTDKQDEINASLLKRLVICHDHLGQIEEMNTRFAQWKKEHSGDPSLARHRELLSRRRGSFFKG